MSTVSITKNYMEEMFSQYLRKLFMLPEVISCGVKGISITRENIDKYSKQAFEAGYHDIYSDVDLHIEVCLPQDCSITPEDYLYRTERFGITEDTALGWMFVPIDNVCRVVFKNGMRYDLIFDFEYSEADKDIIQNSAEKVENENWPIENINRFWFIQVQALGKLYRRDYLISAHLANMNCNDTLVMQMIMRDLEHGISHHRYGYSEELEYSKYLGKNQFTGDVTTFNQIADKIYAAAIAYDSLVKYFYPEYQNRRDVFFDIWKSYNSGSEDES